MAEPVGFTAPDRHLAEEDRIELTTVGVDIGSATSHLIFSHLQLERVGSRYVTVGRRTRFESDILLTPYVARTTIDGAALGRFIARQYERAGLRREEIDTGALILTGVAVQKENARGIADLFASEAGRFVAVSAGDNLEAIMAAHGSGAAALSAQDERVILNVDMGGGTVKFAVCLGGNVTHTAAMDIGARLVVTDESGGVTGIEEAGRRIAESVGIGLKLGEPVSKTQLESLADYMAARVTEVIRRKPLSPATERLLRTPPLGYSGRTDGIVFSGGVSEFIYEDSQESFGDLGPLLASAVRRSLAELGAKVLRPRAGIRATVIGASQYTVQVSGSTIYISSPDAVPVRNVPVVRPEIAFADAIDASAVEAAVDRSVRRFDLHEAGTPVALMLEWEGTATFHRLNGLCRGIIAGLNEKLQRRTPLVLVSRGDIGGLLGIHMKEELRVSNPVISIDGIRLSEFDFVDIGNFIPSSGAVPVIIKSLVFPS